jgi:hypothetical protein
MMPIALKPLFGLMLWDVTMSLVNNITATESTAVKKQLDWIWYTEKSSMPIAKCPIHALHPPYLPRG